MGDKQGDRKLIIANERSLFLTVYSPRGTIITLAAHSAIRTRAQ